MFDVPLSSVEKIKKEVKRVGFKLLKGRFLNDNPADKYLKVVLAENNIEFAVWLYNESLDGLYEGTYFIKKNYEEENQAKKEALRCYYTKN